MNSPKRITRSSTSRITGDWEDPLFWFHTKAEGSLEYTTLFYVPAKAPLDLYQAEYKVGVKLYVKRVFIMDDSRELLPQYLRFVRGIIDSEDLPLNVSREILQQNRVLTSIRTASVKKILSELKNIAANQPEEYLKFITRVQSAAEGRPLRRLCQSRDAAGSDPLQVHQGGRPDQPGRSRSRA